MSASNRGEGETPRLFTPSESTTSSKRSVLRKKSLAEKLVLELKIAEQTFANEIECLRAEQQQRAETFGTSKERTLVQYTQSDTFRQNNFSICTV